MSIPTQTIISAGEPGIVLLEHVNINVPVDSPSLPFYTSEEGLNLPLDTRKSFNIPVFGQKTLWVNAGASQIHLPTGPTGQHFRGRIGLLTDGPITSYLPNAISSTPDPNPSCVLKSPEGQEFHIRPATESKIDLLTYRGTFWSADQNLTPTGTETTPPPLSTTYGKDPPSPSTGSIIGLDYVRSSVPPSTVPSILNFYSHLFGSTVSSPTPGTGIISIGGITPSGSPIQSLIYTEDSSTTPYDGHHLAVYVGGGIPGFREVFKRAKELGVVWVNPRFSDKAMEIEEAMECMQFRFKDIVDVESKEVLFEMEHEVRCSEHKDNRSNLD
ncbi:hypothetical protein TrVE_jg6325 [Triparma verrucosa]|uniref:Uncharacterized protein n=1 Tax=Triparma verrucosa TaxID=1606542 RepID=A0A9W7C0Y0_9STRA|nr:hypothetical protein TrVE_jg6325 [Triparma verrucosa]